VEEDKCSRPLFRRIYKGNVVKNIIALLLFLISIIVFSQEKSSENLKKQQIGSGDNKEVNEVDTLFERKMHSKLGEKPLEKIELYSLEGSDVTTGDIVNFKVVSKYEYDYLKKYKNKRIAEILYVIDISEENQNIFIRAILADPIKKKTKPDLEVEKEYEFIIKNLNVKPSDLQKLKDFIIFEGPKVKFAQKMREIGIPILIILISLGIVGFASFIYLKRKSKREARELKQKTLTLVSNAKAEKDLEQIYSLRNKIENDLDYDEKAYIAFLASLNKVQYKQKWSLEDHPEVNTSFNKFQVSARIKDGV
jgi:hypothetical protein